MGTQLHKIGNPSIRDELVTLNPLKIGNIPTALTKRYAKLYNKMLLMIPRYFADRIATQIHHININP